MGECRWVHSRTVALGASVDYALRMVCKSGDINAIFLALQLFGMLALLAIVNLKSFVILGDECKLPGVIEVEGGDRVRFLICTWAESLNGPVSSLGVQQFIFASRTNPRGREGGDHFGDLGVRRSLRGGRVGECCRHIPAARLLQRELR